MGQLRDKMHNLVWSDIFFAIQNIERNTNSVMGNDLFFQLDRSLREPVETKVINQTRDVIFFQLIRKSKLEYNL